MSDMKPCPVEGCQELRGSHQLVCRAHWGKLPRAQQRDVANAWTLYRTTSDPDEKLAAVMAWRKAATAAIAWLSNLGNRDVGAGA
jgi:hypothetical protein